MRTCVNGGRPGGGFSSIQVSADAIPMASPDTFDKDRITIFECHLDQFVKVKQVRNINDWIGLVSLRIP